MATEVIRDPAAAIPTTGTRIASALVGGQLAGLLMVALLMAVSALLLKVSITLPLQLMASLLLGHDALSDAGPAVLATGFFLHQFVASLGWSLMFFASVMFIRERLDLNRCLMIGFLIGIASMVIDVFLIGPPLQEVTSGENLWMKYLPRRWDWAAHMVYGMSLGGFYWLARNAIEKRMGLVKRIHAPTSVTADDSGVTRTTDGRTKRMR